MVVVQFSNRVIGAMNGGVTIFDKVIGAMHGVYSCMTIFLQLGYHFEKFRKNS